jgi:phosphoglycerate dehydrogenase-like enzyme
MTAEATTIGPVAVLDPMSWAIQDKVRGYAEGLDLRFTASSSDADFAEAVKGAPYIVPRSLGLPASVLRGADSVRLVHQWGTGYDKIPLDVARKMGVTVARSPGVNAPTLADLTIGLMIAALRRIPQHHNNTRAGKWIVPAMVHGARDLNGRKVGLIGFGAIGQLVAQRLTGFGCDVLYYRRSGLVEGATARFAERDEILSTCDVVSLHMPLTDASRHTIGADELERMQPGALLVNTGRGGLIDEAALITALTEGCIAGAALDVFAQEPVGPENPLLKMDNVISLPHIGGHTEDNLQRMVRHWAGNIRAFHEGRAIEESCLVT